MSARRTFSALFLVLLLSPPLGATETRLTTVDAANTHPTWSWAQSYIAYQTDRQYPGTNIRYMSDPRRWDAPVTTHASRNYARPCWAQSGDLAFDGDNDAGHDRVWRILPGTPYASELSDPASGDDGAPHYRDGSGFVLHSSRSGDDEICWMSTSGEVGGFSELTDNASADRYPCWSPDGNWIAFASDRSGNWDIWIMSAAGESDSVRQLTTDPADESGPDWSPTGEFLAFHREGSGIVAIDVASRTEHQVTADPTDAWPSWSGDGGRIAFARGTGVSHIWMTDNVPASSIEASSWGRLKALFR